MSIIAPSIRRPWWPYATVAAALVLVGAVALSTLAVRGGGTSSAPATSVAAPGVEQAPWKIKVAAASGGGSVVTQHGDDVEATVQGVYDAAFLQTGALASSAKDFISGPAATAFEKDKLGLPNGAEDVKITAREANVVIEPTGRAAAAVVTMTVEESASGEEFSLRHKATLWVERDGSDWKVIGYDAMQEPQR